MKRFTRTVLLLAAAFFASSTAPALATGGHSLPDGRHLAVAIVLITGVLLHRFLGGHNGGSPL